MSSPSSEGGALEQLGISADDIDLALTAQLVVAWAGERGEEKRLAWWRTDMVSEFGGEDLFKRLMPTTWRWAVLQAAREAARRTDEQLRQQADDPDRIFSLFRFGFEIDELIEERLLELKRCQPDPKGALPGLEVIQEHWDPEAFRQWLRGHGSTDSKKVPIGRRLAGEPPEALGERVKRLVAALDPPPESYPMPHFRSAR